MSIEKFLNYLQYERRYSEHTLNAYRIDLRQFEAYVCADQEGRGEEAVIEASYTDMRSWVIGMVDQGMSPRTVNRKLAALSAYFQYLHERGIITQNPAQRLMSLKAPKALPQFVPADEMELVLESSAYPPGFEGDRDRLVMELLYGAGLRRGELIALTLSSVDFSRQLLKVVGKGSKTRFIPLTDRLAKLLKDYSEQYLAFPNDPLVLTNSQKPAYPMLIQRIVQKYLAGAKGLDRKSPHALRHSFATHLLDQGADLGAIRELLGHESLGATQVYTHNALSRLKDVFDKAHPRASAKGKDNK